VLLYKTIPKYKLQKFKMYMEMRILTFLVYKSCNALNWSRCTKWSLLNTQIALPHAARSRHFTEARLKVPTSCTPKVVKTTCLKPKKVPNVTIMKMELAGSNIIALNIVASSSRLVHRSFKRESRTLPKILSWSSEGIDSLSSTSPKPKRKECWRR